MESWQQVKISFLCDRVKYWIYFPWYINAELFWLETNILLNISARQMHCRHTSVTTFYFTCLITLKPHELFFTIGDECPLQFITRGY